MQTTPCRRWQRNLFGISTRWSFRHTLFHCCLENRVEICLDARSDCVFERATAAVGAFCLAHPRCSSAKCDARIYYQMSTGSDTCQPATSAKTPSHFELILPILLCPA